MKIHMLLLAVGLTGIACAQPPRKPPPRPQTPLEKKIQQDLNRPYKGNSSIQKEIERDNKETQRKAKAAVESNYQGIFGDEAFPTTQDAQTGSRPVAPPGAVRTPVHKAAAKGDLEGLTALIEAGGDPGAPDSQGNTPLHLSAGQGDWKMVEYLLGRGVAIEKANYRGETPLHLAARRGALEVGEALIRAGAPLQARDFEGRTPLDLAKKCTQASARELEAALSKATQ